MSACGYLLLRRRGSLWGVANAAVRGLAARGGGYRVRLELEGAELEADEVVGLVADLEVRPAAALARFWPEASAGLAVHQGVPVVIVDPRRPPRALVPEPEGGDFADA